VKNNEFASEDLRKSFVSPPDGSSAAEDCPAPEQIMKAVLGQLSTEENRSLADHSTVCPACTLAWKLARDFVEESDLEARDVAPNSVIRTRWRPRLQWRWVPAAAALAAALALVAILVPSQESTEPVLRTLEREEIESTTPEDEPLPADRFTLRWSPGPEGARYDIRVTDRRLEHLAGAASLERPEYTVPANALANLERGSLVLWQVEAVLPDGRRIVSQTFVTPLE